MNQQHIRNFCIIAHIDHGKSTLADRMMELTGTVDKRDMKSQLLDSMDLEREKGITIKLAPVRMSYTYTVERSASSDPAVLVRAMSNSTSLRPLDHPRISSPRSTSSSSSVYDLNLIDTPGHVDFSYEVSRSLQACEGAVLVVDASQGIQAQTLANVYLALEQDLTIIPVLNKVDLPAADVPRVSKQVINLLGCDESDIIKISAKTGENIDQVLRAVIERIPPPISPLEQKLHFNSSVKGLSFGKEDVVQNENIPTRALIFDSYYDDYRGVILYVRVVDGAIAKSDDIAMLATGAEAIALEVGHLSPKMTPDPRLDTGEIGYIVTNLRTTRDARVGDTVTLKKYLAKET